MKINSIRLYNFSSYEGENVFDFTSTDEKNIVLIGGKNGAGKTSLFTAIKIALYGPLAYGYVGVNPRYISKVKEFINTKAFQKNRVETEIQITIDLKIEREIKKYVITRKWDYTNHKLNEEYYVESEGHILSEQELSYFQNYLQGILPPELFEFFLFDGEEVGNIFSTSNYNAYIKNAVFILCGLDVFEIIRKYTGNYLAKSKSIEDEKIRSEYEDEKKAIEKLSMRKKDLESDIDSAKTELDNIEVNLVELETAYKNAGGILDNERKMLEEQYKLAESRKAEAAAKIKMFVEDMMPFIIVQSLTSDIIKQLESEEKGEIFKYIQRKIPIEQINKVLHESGIDNVNLSKQLLETILSEFKPRTVNNNSELRFDLSKGEMTHLSGMISSINGFNKSDMIEIINSRIESAERTIEINKKLKSAMSDEDAVRFSENENKLLKKKEIISSKLYKLQSELEMLTQEIEALVQHKEMLILSIKNNAQNKHVYELSSGLSDMMTELLTERTIQIRTKLEELIVQNLKKIYRKNNLITHIDVTEDFQFILYQDEQYKVDEILYLIKNLGASDFFNQMGSKGKQKLFTQYGVDNINDLKHRLETKDGSEIISLYKRIELSRLSKGERQIFILSLYWAITILSGQEIPFIIDTPYARIDANHRKEISEKFFPNISGQVIILSTDEEINEEYYGILKPYISQRYLLVNDENQNKTSVENHYFFEV
ncbi:AAA family ATPase [Mogibacterium sp.]